MSSAAASSAFILALSSATPGARRRAPPFPIGGANLSFPLWAPPPPPRARRDAVVVRAEVGPGGKDAAPPERSTDAVAADADASSSRQPRARRKTVYKRKDPVQPVGRYVSRDAAAVSSQNGALAGGEIKAIFAAPPVSIVKFEGPDYTVILPTEDTEFRTPPASIPKPDTDGNAEVAEKKRAQVGVQEVPNPIAPPTQPEPSVQEATWDFKKYIGFDDPAETEDDGAGVHADASGSFEHYEDNDPRPLAGENVMNVIVVAAECSPWCKTGKDDITVVLEMLLELFPRLWQEEVIVLW
nr:unnamed protein product [Digitaria exilis]